MKWHHSPVHKLGSAGAYMVTCGTLRKEHFFRDPERLNRIQELLFDLALRYEWDLQAWALLSNHYHFVALSPSDSTTLKRFLQHFHSVSAREVNALDDTPGRKVWFQYWDTHITFERSYYARLAYVHKNAVHHGLVLEATAYPWCSAPWLERTAEPAFFQQILKYGTERLEIPDDY